MAGARYLVENFFDLVMFPRHTLTASEAAAGHQAFRVGNARRQARDYWGPTTANSAESVTVTCDRVRYADMMAIDRNNNLGGKTIRLRASNSSSFASYTEVAARIPTKVYSGKQTSSKNGALTDEGAWVLKFDGIAAKYWRLHVDAGGSGFKPQVGGLYVGRSFAPINKPLMPWSEESVNLIYSETVSPELWAASERKKGRREDSATFRLTGEQEYQAVRYHCGELLWGRHPNGAFNAWYVPDEDNAERAWYGAAPSATHGARFTDDGLKRMLTISLVEQEPRAR